MAHIEELDLIVDIVVFRLRAEALQVLLIKRRNPPFERLWALPGGFVLADETLEAAACRMLESETGVPRPSFIEQLYTFGDPGRDPRGRVISVTYYAALPPGEGQLVAGDDTLDARWFALSDLPKLAFDHTRIIAYARTRLRYKLEYADVVFALLGEQFTLSELQRAYEIILNEELDKRNFRRRILQSHILEETGNMRTGEGRPAKLYRLSAAAPPEVKARRLFP
jgi:8-oxo-dGTP diphosphatase